MNNIQTLGELKKSEYTPLSIKEEIRKNYIHKIQNGEPIFPGMHAYSQSVIPDIELSILAGHNILFLGLRGQGKTRMARQLTDFLDDYIPYVDGLEIPDDPIQPVTESGKKKVSELGDKCPVAWLHRSERIIEKLATPDVNIADLIGDVDPIKAATLQLPYSDERVIHYGLIPRSHRCIFILNELPDLQPRIQVSLFNILEEGDIQIRGFKKKLPLDIQFVFTANPEDYTNRGNIITPLKDRIESQILTHYPREIKDMIAISRQEAHVPKSIAASVEIPTLIEELIAEVMIVARQSELVEFESGVSERMNITMRELVYSSVYRRLLVNKVESGVARIIDLYSVFPAITGKLELTYEGEQEGIENVAMHLLGEAIEERYTKYFDEEHLQKSRNKNFLKIKKFFEKGNQILISPEVSDEKHIEALSSIHGAVKLVQSLENSDINEILMLELLIFGLTEVEVLSKQDLAQSFIIEDPLGDMFSEFDDFDSSDDDSF